ncbi:sugar nucleotide-binding protein, partial [Petrachloros mirabilis]
KEKEEFGVVADQYGAPTSAELIADLTALALHRAVQNGSHKDLTGTYHLVARGETSWHGYAQYIVTVARERGITLKTAPDDVYPIQTEAYPSPAKRPRNSRLNVSKLTKIFGVYLPEWHIHVKRLIEELASQGSL